MLQCFVCSLIPKVSEEKGATGQSFIRKEITTCRIGTLVAIKEMGIKYMGIFNSTFSHNGNGKKYVN